MRLFGGFRRGGGSGSAAPAPAPPTPASVNDGVAASALVWSLARPPIATTPAMARTPAPRDVEDSALVARVQAAYRAAVAGFEETGSFWDTTISQIRKPVHQALVGADPATAVLRNPADNAHFWGFDAICKAPEGQTEPHELVMRNMGGTLDWEVLYAKWLHDALVSLAEAVGALRVFYPETTPGHHYALFGEPSDVDLLLARIEEAIGQPLRFPNPYAGEFGLASSRGVIGFRSLQAVYQAWRLMRLSEGRTGFRVLEIGAGLGRTAFFAHGFGVTDYTIVDIPLTNAAQGYFLGRTLGPDRVRLFGEAGDATVRVLPPQALKGMTETFDLVLNVDSFTEMARETALDYWTFARANAAGLLSINHELNPHPVRTLYADDPGVRATRHPYWMRRGYVEEHLTWPRRGDPAPGR